MATDRDAQLRNLIAGYSDSIRLSDIKANIAVLFVAIMMMGTVLQFRELYPRYLSVPALLAPFMFTFLNLLVSVYPRYPRTGRNRCPIRRNPQPEDFEFLADVQSDSGRCPSDARCSLAFSGGKQSPFRPPMSPRCSRSPPRRILLLATRI